MCPNGHRSRHPNDTETKIRERHVMPAAGTPPASQLPLAGWHTSVLDGYSHAVTDGAFTDDVRRRHGKLKTVCGLIIYLTASVIPCGRPCPRCTTLLRPTPPRTRQPTPGRYGAVSAGCVAYRVATNGGVNA